MAMKEPSTSTGKSKPSNEELSRKLSTLKRDYEKITRELEEIKAENEMLLSKNKVFEDRVKALEGQQPIETNESLIMPKPLSLDPEILKAKLMKEVQKIAAIIEQSKGNEETENLAVQSDQTILNADDYQISAERSLAEAISTLEANIALQPSLLMRQVRLSNRSLLLFLFRYFKEQEIFENIGILKNVDATSVDPKNESVKNQFEELLELNEKKLSCKKVRLSHLRQSKAEIKALQVPGEEKPFDTEKLSDFLRRNSSLNSSNSSFQYRGRSSSRFPSFLLNTLHDKSLLIKHSINVIKIQIVSLTLVEDSELLNTDEVRHLYIEYSFLGYKGHLLETQSLAQPMKPNEPLYYRFKQKFETNPEKSENQLKMLKRMLTKDTKDEIKFVVVSEPIDSDEKECEEVGFAYLNLYSVVKAATNDTETSKESVYSSVFPHSLVAFLHVKITGISFLRDLMHIRACD